MKFPIGGLNKKIQKYKYKKYKNTKIQKYKNTKYKIQKNSLLHKDIPSFVVHL